MNIKLTAHLSKSVKKWGQVILKITISLLAWLILIEQINNFNNLDLTFFQTISIKKIIFYAIILIILMGLNWSVEAVKWQRLIKNIEKISFRHSLKAVFIALPMAITTPARIGDLLGRSIVLQKQNRKKGIWATTLGSFSQQIITIVCGLFALTTILNLRLINSYSEFFKYSHYLFAFFFIITFIFIFIYLKFNTFVTHFAKYRFFKRYFKHTTHFSELKNSDLITVLLLSGLRYLIFFSQFYLLFQLFGVPITLFQAFIVIGLTYFIISFLPSSIILELGIRGSVILFVFSLFYTRFNANVLTAGFVIYGINLLLPAMFGLIIWYKTKW